MPTHTHAAAPPRADGAPPIRRAARDADELARAYAALRAAEAARDAALEELELVREQLREANAFRAELLDSTLEDELAERDLLLGEVALLDAELRLHGASGLSAVGLRAGVARRFPG